MSSSIPMMSGPNCIDQVLSSCCTRPTLAYERLAQVHQASLPLDLSVVADHAHGDLGSVLRRTDAPRVGPHRRRVQAGRRHLPERLVRSLVVVAVPEAVEGTALTPAVGMRRRGGLGLERPVQPLKATVLPGCPGSMRSGMIPSLTHHTDSGERLPSPTLANGTPLSVRWPWEGRTPGSGSSTRLASRPLGRSSLTHQQIPRCRVLHSQRVDPCPVCGAEPPLEVDRPHVVWPLGPEKGSCCAACAADASPVRRGPA